MTPSETSFFALTRKKEMEQHTLKNVNTSGGQISNDCLVLLVIGVSIVWDFQVVYFVYWDKEGVNLPMVRTQGEFVLNYGIRAKAIVFHALFY